MEQQLFGFPTKPVEGDDGHQVPAMAWDLEFRGFDEPLLSGDSSHEVGSLATRSSQTASSRSRCNSSNFLSAMGRRSLDSGAPRGNT
jgi:hypothetical protein